MLKLGVAKSRKLNRSLIELFLLLPIFTQLAIDYELSKVNLAFIYSARN